MNGHAYRIAAAAVALVAALGLAGCGSSERSKLETAMDRAGESFDCAKAGVMAVAGGRSTLYRCVAVNADGTTAAASICAVWANGAAYNVTVQAHAIFRLQKQPPPC